jgi:hypothetical protein
MVQLYSRVPTAAQGGRSGERPLKLSVVQYVTGKLGHGPAISSVELLGDNSSIIRDGMNVVAAAAVTDQAVERGSEDPIVVVWVEADLKPSTDSPLTRTFDFDMTSWRLTMGREHPLAAYTLLQAMVCAWDLCRYVFPPECYLDGSPASAPVGCGFPQLAQVAVHDDATRRTFTRVTAPPQVCLPSLEHWAYVQYLEVAALMIGKETFHLASQSVACVRALHRIVEHTNVMVSKSLDLSRETTPAGVAKQVAKFAVAGAQSACVALRQKKAGTQQAKGGVPMDTQHAVGVTTDFQTVLEMCVSHVTQCYSMVSETAVDVCLSIYLSLYLSVFLSLSLSLSLSELSLSLSL